MASSSGLVRTPQLRSQAPGPATSRLVLDPEAVGRSRLDGGWWPASRDAGQELPRLVADLNARIGVVLRLGVDALAWDAIPRRITVAGHVVRVGWFPDMNHMIIITRGRQDFVMLLVVPPDAPPVAARAALAQSARPGTTGPQEILTACGIHTEPPPLMSVRPRRPRQ